MNEAITPVGLFKCLADETRARMTLLIARQSELCVCELTAALGESQPKVSRHLAQLRGCGLLEDERRGQWVYYRLHPELPDWVRDVLARVLASKGEWLAADLQRLNRMAGTAGSTDRCEARPLNV